MEVYVLVPVRKTVVAKVVGTLMLVLAVVSLLASCLTSGITLPVALVCGIVWFVLMGNSKEFEYSYFDGEVRFAKVLNKNRRKSLGSYPMDDVSFYKVLCLVSQDKSKNILCHTYSIYLQR